MFNFILNHLKLYRKKTRGIIINSSGRYLIAQLTSYKNDEWTFPGGGIEKGETEEKAMIRELREELGTDKFVILKKSKQIDYYGWPIYFVLKKIVINKKFYIGQSVRHFLVKFIGKNNEIVPDKFEVRKVKWVEGKDLKKYLVFPNQFETIKKVLREFGIQIV